MFGYAPYGSSEWTSYIRTISRSKEPPSLRPLYVRLTLAYCSLYIPREEQLRSVVRASQRYLVWVCYFPTSWCSRWICFAPPPTPTPPPPPPSPYTGTTARKCPCLTLLKLPVPLTTWIPLLPSTLDWPLYQNNNLLSSFPPFPHHTPLN